MIFFASEILGRVCIVCVCICMYVYIKNSSKCDSWTATLLFQVTYFGMYWYVKKILIFEVSGVWYGSTQVVGVMGLLFSICFAPISNWAVLQKNSFYKHGEKVFLIEKSEKTGIPKHQNRFKSNLKKKS